MYNIKRYKPKDKLQIYSWYLFYGLSSNINLIPFLLSWIYKASIGFYA